MRPLITMDLEPRKALQAEPVAAAAVDNDHEDALTLPAAEDSPRRTWIHVEVLGTHLCDQAARRTFPLGAGELIDEQLSEDAARGIAVEPQLSLIHLFLSLLLAQISRS
jgi:hypothetical protein